MYSKWVGTTVKYTVFIPYAMCVVQPNWYTRIGTPQPTTAHIRSFRPGYSRISQHPADDEGLSVVPEVIAHRPPFSIVIYLDAPFVRLVSYQTHVLRIKPPCAKGKEKAR